MGGGRWDTDTYKSLRSARMSVATAKGIAPTKVDYAYSERAQQDRTIGVHPNLNPRRINKKPFGKLESRDSKEHPESNAVFVSFDVTGSNYSRAVVAQQKLPDLMDLLNKYLKDPQVLVAANDDYNVEGRRSVQISDYESDNRIDDHIRNVILVGKGGSNMGESYDLVLYAAARLTVLDCVEKRKKKGYLFMYADEPFFPKCKEDEIRDIFGIDEQADIPIKDLIKEARKLYNIFIIWPMGGYMDAREQYVKLFGDESVLTLQDPNLICELIASVVGISEEMNEAELVDDLTKFGLSKKVAGEILNTAKKGRKFGDLPEGPEAL